MTPPPPAGRAWPARAARFLLRDRTRLALAWFAAAVCAGSAAYYAWTGCDTPARRDGNYGHANIDFGAQWLMGRVLVTGNGPRLYDRITLRRVLEESFPPADWQDPRPDEEKEQDAKPFQGDAQQLLDWMRGDDDPRAAAAAGGYLAPLAARDPVGAAAYLAAGRVAWRPVEPQLGGPLYPPVNACLFAPLGLLPPRPAYRAMQVLILALTFATGVLTQRVTGGRVWLPVAVLWLSAFPGYSGAIGLGQNAPVSLFVLVLGWRLLQLGRPARAGAAWGLLVYKAVWAAAFLLVPLLTRRWRMAAAMAATTAAACAATLPLVGWRAWVDWLRVGSMASEFYTHCQTWIFLSRDLLGIPRRYLLTFTDGHAPPDDPNAALATALGLVLWLVPLAVTALVVLRRGRRAAGAGGPRAAFVLLGAWMACYHFMYYDTLLAFLPCCLLHAEPRRLWRRFAFRRPGTRRWLARAAVTTGLLACVIAFPYFSSLLDPAYHFPPWDTFFLVLLWLWCEVPRGRVSADPAERGDGDAGVGGPNERLADEHGPHPAGPQPLHVVGPADAALAHQADAGRDGRGDLERVLEPRHERP